MIGMGGVTVRGTMDGGLVELVVNEKKRITWKKKRAGPGSFVFVFSARFNDS